MLVLKDDSLSSVWDEVRNLLPRYSHALGKHIRGLGVRGLIDLVRSSIATPWFNAGTLRQIAAGPCHLRLE